MRATFSPAEVRYLTSERLLGRLATVQPDGQLHLVPTGWTLDVDLGVIDVSGRDFARTRKYRNAQGDPRVAFLVDDVLPPWRPRSVMVQGTAEVLDDRLRIHPVHIRSWGLGDEEETGPPAGEPST